MSLTMPYGQNHYMGECATESAALVWIRDNKWDSAGNGTGNPQAGMAFFDTGATKLKVHDGSAWVALGSATPGGSSGQIQYNNSSAFGGASQLYWDSGNAGLAYGKTTVDGSRIDVVTVEGTYPYQATMHGSNQSYGCFVSIRKARGSQGSETTVADGDPIGGVSLRAYGSAYTTVAAIKATVSGTVSGNNIPTKLELQTHNGTAFDTRVLITAAGKVGIANASPVALLALGTAGTTAGSLSLAGATSGTCTIQVAAAAGTVTFQLPSTNGTNGYYLQTNGSGVTSWAQVTAAAAGSTGYVQFNNAGALAGDAAFFWDNTNKRLGIGCTDPVNAVEISKDTANTSMFASVFSSSTNYASVYVQRGRGTRASKSAVQSGDRLGQFGFAGYYDTSGNYGCAFVAAYATENWGAGARGSDLRFEVTAATTATVSERMRITSAGNVFIGTTAGVSVGATTQTHPLIVYGTDATPQFNGIISEGGACPGRFNGHRHNGTYGTKTAVATTQNILAINALGWDGGTTPTYVNAAAISFTVDGTVAEDSVPGKIIFYTREVGNTVGPYERMVITNAGRVGIGNNAPSAMLTLGTNGIISGAIDLLGATSGTCTVRVAAVAGTSTVFQLPVTNGTNGYFLRTDGTGVTSWAAVSATPAGSNTQVQYNNSGAFGASANFTFSGTTLTVGGDSALAYSYVECYGTSYTPSAVTRRGRGSRATPTAVNSGDVLGVVNWQGHDGSGWGNAAFIQANAENNFSGSYHQASLLFYMMNGVSQTERMRLTSAGKLGIANVSPSALLTLGTAGTTAGTLSLAGSSSGTCTVQVAAAAGTTTFQLPASNGTNGYFLQTNGSGVTTWAAASVTPAGSNYQLQYYNSGAFGASANLTWDGTSRLYVYGDGNYATVETWCYATGTTTAAIHGYYRFNGSKSSYSAVTTGDILGEELFHGSYNASSYAVGWRVGAVAKSSWSSGNQPSYFRFIARADGTTDVQIMRLDYQGNVAIGTHTTATERLDLQDGSANGAIRVGNTASSNAGTIKYTSNTFSGYNGSSWVNFGAGAPAGSTGYVQFNNAGAFAADAALFWDNTNKRVGIGTVSPSAPIHVYSSGATNPLHQVQLEAQTTAGNGGQVLLQTSRAAGAASQSGDYIGGIKWQGRNTTPAYSNSAAVFGLVDASPTASAVPTAITFWTMNSSASWAERLRISSDGKVATGAESAPDVDPGGLCIHHGANDGYPLTFKNSDVNHPFTAICEADTYLRTNKTDSAAGGANFVGLGTGTGGIGLLLGGANSNPVSGTSDGCVCIVGYKSNGTTGFAALAATENLAAFRSYTTTQVIIKGSGDIHTVAGLKIGAYGQTAAAGAIEWNGTNFRGYTGSAWKNLDAGGATVDAGTAQGQVLFWNNAGSAWTYAETSEWVWDDTNKRVGINEAAPSSRLDVGGDVEIASNGWHYYGDPSTDGSWRTGRVSADLVVQKRESGTWNTKHTFS